MERRLGKFVHKHLNTNEFLGSLQKLGVDKEIPSVLDSVRRFKEDSSSGMDGSIIEYLYLSDLFILISEHALFKLLGYKKRDDFEKGSGKLKHLRNIISHPNKSIVKGPESLDDLWKSSMKIDELVKSLSLD